MESLIQCFDRTLSLQSPLSTSNATSDIPLEYQMLLISGYIRQCAVYHASHLFDRKAISKIVLDFYHKKIMNWYTEHCGDNLIFNLNSVSKQTEDCSRSSFLFGQESINISDYNEYRIKFSWSGKYFFMGYTTIPLNEYVDKTDDWDFLTYEDSVSIEVDPNNDKFILYDRERVTYATEEDRSLEYIYKYEDGEVFEMVFDLKGREWIIYHNDKRAITLPISPTQKTIHVAFSVSGYGIEKINILNYSLIKTIRPLSARL